MKEVLRYKHLLKEKSGEKCIPGGKRTSQKVSCVQTPPPYKKYRGESRDVFVPIFFFFFFNF